MWFKNLKLYRLALSADLSLLQSALEAQKFQSCASQESQSSGWVPPRPDLGGGLVYAPHGQMLICLRTEKRLLPASVVNLAARERAKQIEDQQGYRPSREPERAQAHARHGESRGHRIDGGVEGHAKR